MYSIHVGDILALCQGIRKEACWTISNITAGTKEQIQTVVDSAIIPPLIDLLTNAEFDIKKEAAWYIALQPFLFPANSPTI